MSKEEIDKWLDNEYGVSYTRLEELHDFLIEQNMKYQDKSDYLQQKIDKAIEYIKECQEVWHKRGDHWENELVDGTKLLEILGDKQNE